jgi:hypothetical protein
VNAINPSRDLARPGGRFARPADAIVHVCKAASVDFTAFGRFSTLADFDVFLRAGAANRELPLDAIRP